MERDTNMPIEKESSESEVIEASRINIRAPRASSSRASRSRVSEERSPIVFGAGSRFNLPLSVIKKLKDAGKVAGFVVYSSGNMEQKENYFDAIDRGW